VLGHHAIKKPKFNFHGDNAKAGRFLQASFTFENTGVHAYAGQAFNIEEPAVLAKALSIITVEARRPLLARLGLRPAAIAPSGYRGPDSVLAVLEALEHRATWSRFGL